MKKPTIKSVVEKTIIIVILWAVLLAVKGVMFVPINNTATIMQMEDSNTAYIAFKSYSHMWAGINGVAALLTVLAYIKEAKYLIKLLTKNEN